MGPAQGQDGAIRPYCNGVHLSRLLQIPCACKVPGTSKDSYAKTTARMQLQDTQTLISTGLLQMQLFVCTHIHEVRGYACWARQKLHKCIHL